MLVSGINVNTCHSDNVSLGRYNWNSTMPCIDDGDTSVSDKRSRQAVSLGEGHGDVLAVWRHYGGTSPEPLRSTSNVYPATTTRDTSILVALESPPAAAFW
ncbi:hypothetical protein MTO96_013189 [Rhipicephalus appendiculatus]